MDIQVTDQEVWLSALLFAALDLVVLVPLVLVFKSEVFRVASRLIVFASAVFWGTVAVVAIRGFWEMYYRHIYPAWVRLLVPLDVLLYGGIGLGLWWLAIRVGGPSVLAFALLGGIEGIAEHLFGIYALRILDKVPLLQGLAPLPVVVFSFFEYVLYWTLVAWLAFGLVKAGSLIGIRY